MKSESVEGGNSYDMMGATCSLLGTGYQRGNRRVGLRRGLENPSILKMSKEAIIYLVS